MNTNDSERVKHPSTPPGPPEIPAFSAEEAIAWNQFNEATQHHIEAQRQDASKRNSEPPRLPNSK